MDLIPDDQWREAELLSRFMLHALEALNRNDLPTFRRWTERILEEMSKEKAHD